MIALGLAQLVGCAEPQPELELATPDQAAFVGQVYPLLLRDCGFHACHGSSERFFQVYGPGRGRLTLETRAIDPATQEEVALTYERARSMVDPDRPLESLLLRKPLSVAVQGAGHEGVDSLGRDVYESETAAGYLVLRAWVLGGLAGAAPAAGMPTASTP
jgi:hypothetical protein